MSWGEVADLDGILMMKIRLFMILLLDRVDSGDKAIMAESGAKR
jgi:hypothetical protein